MGCQQALSGTDKDNFEIVTSALANANQNFLQFFQQDFLADCTLILSDNSPIPLHKIVLASRSGLFRNQFKNSTNYELKMPIPINPPGQPFNLPADNNEFNQKLFTLIEYFYSNVNQIDFRTILQEKGKLSNTNCLQYLSLAMCLGFTKAVEQLEQYVERNLLTMDNSVNYLQDVVLLQNDVLTKLCMAHVQKRFSSVFLVHDKYRQFFLSLPLYTFIQLLSSDDLQVSSEDQVAQLITEYITIRSQCKEKAPPHFEQDATNAPKLADIELPGFMKEIEGWEKDKEGCVSCWDGIKEYVGSQYPEGLSKDKIIYQEQLVRIYTMETPVYHLVNQALRDDDPVMLHKFAGFINDLREVFSTDHVDQIIDPFIGTVCRGITFPDVQKALELYQVGEVFCWPAFTSTSTNRQVCLGFGNVLFEIACHPSKEMLEDDDPEFAAAPISKWSVYPNEAEILFAPNSKFKIKEVITNSPEYKGTIIKCDTIAFDKKGVGFATFDDFSKKLGTSQKVDIKQKLLDITKPKKQLYPDLDLNHEALANMEKYKMNPAEIKSLITVCRLSFVTPNKTDEFVKVNELKQFEDLIKAAHSNVDKTIMAKENFNNKPRKCYA